MCSGKRSVFLRQCLRRGRFVIKREEKAGEDREGSS